MKSHYEVVIVGGGQAGLSISYCLKERNIDHLVLEKHRIAYAWRTKRWDSFCLVTPNWQCKLPGYDYPGQDPKGFMVKDEIVNYIEEYAKSFNPPIKENVEVLRVAKNNFQNIFKLETTVGDFTADRVVIASGGYHTPKIPPIAEQFSKGILQLHSSEYKNPQALPEGEILVVGTGQSGCQIAEDLHLAGRKVHLCVGSAPRSPRVYRGKDVVEWLEQMGYYDLSIDDHPQKETVRQNTNHYVTGRDNGREIDLRRFYLEGMKLYGSLRSVDGNQLGFKENLKHNLDHADSVAESIKRSVDNFIEKRQITAPKDEPYVPLWQPEQEITHLDYKEAKISAVIWCTGFRSDFGWIDIPVFDAKGYPEHHRGITKVQGLYFLGLPWLYTWGSGRFSGIARDANYLAECIAEKAQINAVALGS